MRWRAGNRVVRCVMSNGLIGDRGLEGKSRHDHHDSVVAIMTFSAPLRR